MRGLVDLDRLNRDLFMPFDINQLQIVWRKTKDLARGDVDAGGLQKAHFGRWDSTRTPGLHTSDGTWIAFARGRQAFNCCLLEETTDVP